MAGRFVLEEDTPGRFVLEEEAVTPTAPSRTIPQRQTSTASRPTGGNWQQQFSRAISGEGSRRADDREFVMGDLDKNPETGASGVLRNVTRAVGLPENIQRGAQQLGSGLDAEFSPEGQAVSWGFFANPSEKARAEIVRRQYPRSEWRRDEYGTLQFRLDQRRPWASLNSAGIGQADVQTFANETGKFIAASRIPGLRAPAAGEGLAISTARAAATAGGVSEAGQAASLALGAEEINQGDAALAAVGGGAGNLIGAGVGAVARALPAIPGAVRNTAQAIGDRFPGGATRAAERQAGVAAQREIAENAVRAQAENAARQAAQQSAQTGAAVQQAGEALEQSVKEAGDAAAARFRAEVAPGGVTRNMTPEQELAEIARQNGVDLAKSQAAGDNEGIRWLHVARGGVYGKRAQNLAIEFFREQERAIPEAIQGVAGTARVASPTDAVNQANTGLRGAFDSSKAVENEAWDVFRQHNKQYGKTHDVTPKGNPGGVQRVYARVQKALTDADVFMQPDAVQKATAARLRVRNGRVTNPNAPGVNEPQPALPRAALPEMQNAFKGVQSVLNLAYQMTQANAKNLPVNDVNRVLLLKRMIDAAWEKSDSQTERRLLTNMGTSVRDWLKTESSAGSVGGVPTLKGRAPVTGSYLQDALNISAKHNQTFRTNPIVQTIVEPPVRGAPTPTDAEISSRLFGGSSYGVTIDGEAVQALRLMKDALGPSSPEWEGLRQAALKKLAGGLEKSIEGGGQMPPYTTLLTNIISAMEKSKEGMEVLFTREELAKLAQVRRIVAAIQPPARNAANTSGTGFVNNDLVSRAWEVAKQTFAKIPGGGFITNVVTDASGAARAASEVRGAVPPPTPTGISNALRDIWTVRRPYNEVTGANVGYNATQNQENNGQ